MTFLDALWSAAVIGLPIAIAWRIFTNAPLGKGFVLPWILSVAGSSIAFSLVLLTATLAKISPFGMFDGFLILPVSFVVATVIGLSIRRQQKRKLRNNNAPNN